MSESQKTARQIAVEALADRQGNVSDHLDRLLDEYDLSPRDRGLARELSLGSLRRRRTLRTVVTAYLRKRRRYLAAPVAEIVETAAYQMLMLDRVPDHAAVDEAVRLTRLTGHKRQAGFVNAVLRSLGRDIADRIDEPPPAAADIVPVDAGRYVRLARTVLADPNERPTRHLGQAWSLPTALAERWTQRHGHDRTWQLAGHAAERPPLIARVNTRLSTVQSVLTSLVEDGVDAAAHGNGRSIVLPGGEDVTRRTAFGDGLIQPQDATATAVLAGEAGLLKTGMAVLDFCAAPGTKTTQLAELTGDSGRIVAVDISEAKVQRIAENCRRMKADSVETRRASEVGSLDPGSFDLVLVDAPCSNTGVLARRPEARWRFKVDDLGKLAGDQKTLLRMAAMFCRPGGHVIYSTCSIEPEENEQVVRAAASTARLKVLCEQATLPAGSEADPTNWHDGGFRAVMRKL
jgi:16S rRNA (cytosine967-C5)-methyltransferase